MAEPSEILGHAHVGQKELLDGGDTISLQIRQDRVA